MYIIKYNPVLFCTSIHLNAYLYTSIFLYTLPLSFLDKKKEPIGSLYMGIIYLTDFCMH